MMLVQVSFIYKANTLIHMKNTKVLHTKKKNTQQSVGKYLRNKKNWNQNISLLFFYINIPRTLIANVYKIFFIAMLVKIPYTQKNI